MKLLAQSVNDVFGEVNPPQQLNKLSGAQGIGTVLSNIIQIIYGVAAVVFIFMIVFGAFQWITSGGDKEAIAKARSRITHAIIGIVLLALSFFFIRIIGRITGFQEYFFFK